MSISGNWQKEKRRISRREFVGLGGMSAAALMLGAGAMPSRAHARAGSNPDGGFQFGLVADAQYCDCPDRGSRHYRASLGKFEEAVDTFNDLDLAFTVHMGDMIDRHEESFSRIVPIFEETRGPKFDVLGNHDYDYAGSTSGETVELLGMPAPYYQFRREGWRFIVLDTNDISLYANPEGSEKYAQAQEILQELEESGAVNAKPYNGAVGDGQLDWLRGVLAGARRRGEKVIVFGHMPLYPKNFHNTWNDETLIETFESSGNVAAYFNGHNHSGNCGEKNGIHYVNLHGMVELDTNAYSVAWVSGERLEITGYGREPDRVLDISRAGAAV